MEQERTEYQKEMDRRVYEMEVTISEHLSKGVTPEVLIAKDRTIIEILQHLEVTPDWSNPEGVFIALGDGEVVLKIIRTVDLQYGFVIIR